MTYEIIFLVIYTAAILFYHTIGNTLDTFSVQTISSTKRFKSNITIVKDLITSGLIDAINITQLFDTSLLMNKTQNITGIKTISEFTADKVKLEKCNEDCEFIETLTNLHQNTVKRTEDPIMLKDKKTFSNNLTVYANLTIDGTLNGEGIPGIFMLQKVTQTITGYNTFEKNVTFKEDVKVVVINDVNINNLYTKVKSKNENLVFNEDITFIDDTDFLANLEVNGTIDGITLPDDIVYTNQNQTVGGKKSFLKKTHVNIFSLHNMTAHGLIDGVNLTQIDSDLMRLSGNQIVKGTKIFKTHVSFAGNWTIEGLIDGVNITELDRTAMRISGDQIVSGRKVRR